MATKLLRKIAFATTGEHVGRLRYFSQHNYYRKKLSNLEPLGALKSRSNRQWRRIESALYEKLNELDFYDLYLLISPEHRELADFDFEYLEADHGREYALSELRRWIVESHLYNELDRVEMDFTHVKSKRPVSIDHFSRQGRRAIKYGHTLKERKKDIRAEASKQNRRRASEALSFNVTNLAMRSPQRSPNAPNFKPALSLAAA